MQWVGKALLFFFILIVLLDPTTTVFHMKDKAFMLLLGYCLIVYKPHWDYLPHILIIVGSMLCGYLSAELQGNIIDEDAATAAFKSVAPLVLLLFVRQFDFVRITIAPAVITTLCLVSLFVAAVSSPLIETAIYLFVKAHDNMIMMTHRSFFGIRFFGMYCKTLMAMTFSVYYVYHRAVHYPHRRFAFIFLGTILTAAFIVSASRATILLPFALLGITAYDRIRQARFGRYLLFPLLGMLALGFLAVILLLASETTEASNVIKYGHLTSYQELFTRHPEYLLIGQGPGTAFYSQGFHKMTTITEWTYLELLRNYGLFSLPILAVFVYPLIRLYRHRRDTLTQGILFTYIVYLLIAGTNPLLLSSTGMIMILSAYAYCEQVDRKGASSVPALH